MKMKFEGYGVDLSTTTIMIDGPIEPKWIMTSIEANNDSTVGWYTSIKKSIPLIVKGGCFIRMKNMLQNHLKFLGRDKAEVLLLPADTPWEVLDEDLPTNDFGIINPESVEQLEEIKKRHKFTYISIDTSPLFYNNEVIEWATSQRIKIIGTNPFGGFLSAARNLQTFSAPFLLKFSCANTDIVMVSGRDMGLAYQDMQFLDECLDIEGAEDFYMRKTIDKSVKPIKKAIDTFINDNGILLSYNAPALLLPDVVTSLAGKKKENLGSLVKDPTDPLQTFMDGVEIPEEMSPGERLALVKYSITDYLRIRYQKEDGWEIFYTMVPSSVIAIRLHKDAVPKKHFWQKGKPEENVSYIVYLTSDRKIFVKRDTLEA